MASLTITNNSISNPLSADLTKFMNVQRDGGMDVSDPAFTEKVWARSLLKEGATLALESLHEKELVFPLELNSTTLTAVLAQIQQINQIVTTPGATCSWQPDGASQATTFDVLSGQVDVEYDFRREGQKWTSVKLRIFTQPLGRTASPRLYATASGVGPLLMISPYASSGALAVSASTQATVAGFGGQQQGASSGVFYWGAPSLAGDALAQLQVSYVGPLPNTATENGSVPYAAISLLPDPSYRVLITSGDFTASTIGIPGPSITTVKQSTSAASQYTSVLCPVGAAGQGALFFPPAPTGAPTLRWAGQQRLFAIARASSTSPSATTALYTGGLFSSPYITTTGSAVIATGLDWGLYDLGTFSLRASQPPNSLIPITVYSTAASPIAIDIAALAMLPDGQTWFLSPGQILESRYGFSALQTFRVGGQYTNTILADDPSGDQFLYVGPSQVSAPSPLGSAPSATPITPYTRGLIPRPDPKNGPPIIAILGVAQNHASPLAGTGASWTNAQNLRTVAQVNVLERTRYVLP